MKILFDIVKTLGKHGLLAFHGSGADINGDFRQIELLLARHNPVLKKWLDNKN